jgi:peptidoglycan/LPS O-acetylase OafA/YrhL
VQATSVSPAQQPPVTVSDAVPRRFTAGDALRGIAAVMVLVFHAARSTVLWQTGAINGEHPEPFRPIFGTFATEFVNMRAGIYIFFVLSGYLLTRAFLAAFTLGTPAPSIPRYLRNRALRIIPAFWVVTSVYLIWAHLRPGGGFLGVAAVYGFAQNYYPTTAAELVGQGWTLDIEVAFYLLIPTAFVIALYGARRLRLPASPRMRLVIVLAVLLGAYSLSLSFKHDVGNPADVTYNIADYLFAFIPGVALAAIEPFAAPRLSGTREGRVWAWAFAIACLVLAAVYVSVSASQNGLRLVLVTSACAALLAAPLVLQWTTGGCWRVFDNRTMRWLGERSYGIYLIHLGLMTHVLSRLGHSHSGRTTFVVLLAVVTVITLIAADVLWRVVEQPALQRRLPWRQAEFIAPATT